MKYLLLLSTLLISLTTLANSQVPNAYKLAPLVNNNSSLCHVRLLLSGQNKVSYTCSSSEKPVELVVYKGIEPAQIELLILEEMQKNFKLLSMTQNRGGRGLSETLFIFSKL